MIRSDQELHVTLERIAKFQAQLENLRVVSNDKIFDAYGVERIW